MIIKDNFLVKLLDNIKTKNTLEDYYVYISQSLETSISNSVNYYNSIINIPNDMIFQKNKLICDSNPYKSYTTNKYMKYKLKYLKIKKKL